MIACPSPSSSATFSALSGAGSSKLTCVGQQLIAFELAGIRAGVLPADRAAERRQPRRRRHEPAGAGDLDEAVIAGAVGAGGRAARHDVDPAAGVEEALEVRGAGVDRVGVRRRADLVEVLRRRVGRVVLRGGDEHRAVGRRGDRQRSRTRASAARRPVGHGGAAGDHLVDGFWKSSSPRSRISTGLVGSGAPARTQLTLAATKAHVGARFSGSSRTQWLSASWPVTTSRPAWAADAGSGEGRQQGGTAGQATTTYVATAVCARSGSPVDGGGRRGRRSPG